MKSLILAFVFFGIMWYGCHDVVPFKPLKRVLRRTPRPQAPAATYESAATYEPPAEAARTPAPSGRRRFR